MRKHICMSRPTPWGHAATAVIAFAASLSVHAAAPTPDPQALATTESALKFCDSRDPVSAKQLQKRVQQLVKGVDEQQLTSLRKSDTYQSTYRSVWDFAQKIAEHNVSRFCREVVAKRK